MEPSSLSPARTVAEAAVILGVSPGTVRKYIVSGELPAFRPGQRLWRVREADLQAYIAARLAQLEAS